jgi:3-oxoacyl-[acyl-carrier-protein] synthase II
MPTAQSTPLNDKIETLAIKKALGEKAYKIFVNSTKSMTGAYAWSGRRAEAIATVMSLATGIIHPTIGLKTPDPNAI